MPGAFQAEEKVLDQAALPEPDEDHEQKRSYEV